jgi:hypothetical protein
MSVIRCYYKVLVLTWLCILSLLCDVMSLECVACLCLLIYLLVGDMVRVLLVGLDCVFNVLVYCV